MKAKKFDSVKMMRDIRDKLSKRYAANPDAEEEDLKRVRALYNMTAR